MIEAQTGHCTTKTDGVHRWQSCILSQPARTVAAVEDFLHCYFIASITLYTDPPVKCRYLQIGCMSSRAHLLSKDQESLIKQFAMGQTLILRNHLYSQVCRPLP